MLKILTASPLLQLRNYAFATKLVTKLDKRQAIQTPNLASGDTNPPTLLHFKYKCSEEHGRPQAGARGYLICPLNKARFTPVKPYDIFGSHKQTTTRNQYASLPEGNAIQAGPLSDSDEKLLFLIDS